MQVWVRLQIEQRIPTGFGGIIRYCGCVRGVRDMPEVVDTRWRRGGCIRGIGCTVEVMGMDWRR